MSTSLALVLEDDHALSRALGRLLKDLGYRVQIAHSITDARQIIRNLAPTLILVDIGLPDGNGLDLMNELRNSTRERFIVITGNSSQRAAIKSIRNRAVEFISKPVSIDELKRLIGNATQPDTTSVAPGKAPRDHRLLNNDRDPGDCWINHGSSNALVELRTAISFSAELRNGHALIIGEPGLEKHSIAYELHKRSRRSGNIVFLDCSAEANTSSALHRKLFGHIDDDKITTVKQGCIDEAAGGTLVLDNVDGISDELQSALSLFLDTGIFKRQNNDQGYKATVAVVGILADNVEADSLRTDFVARLSKVTLYVPNLRDCSSDIVEISHWLSKQICQQTRIEADRFTISSSMEFALSQKQWPDNVRELRGTIHDAIKRANLESKSPRELHLTEPLQHTHWEPFNDLIGLSLRDFGTQLVLATLAHHNGDKARTAKTLGISLKTLYNRMNSH